jgi:ABC-type nickel/cobalt efflux system permease component RcnA
MDQQRNSDTYVDNNVYSSHNSDYQQDNQALLQRNQSNSNNHQHQHQHQHDQQQPQPQTSQSNFWDSIFNHLSTSLVIDVLIVVLVLVKIFYQHVIGFFVVVALGKTFLMSNTVLVSHVHFKVNFQFQFVSFQVN